MLNNIQRKKTNAKKKNKKNPQNFSICKMSLGGNDT